MKKSNTNHGITIEKEIELVMSYKQSTPLYYFILQVIVLVVLSCSIGFSFTSGIGLEIEPWYLMCGISLFAVWFSIIFRMRGYRFYLNLFSILLYIAAGYILFDTLQEGFAHVANRVIALYNAYFKAGVVEFPISVIQAEKEIISFILYVMFPVVGVVCYSAMLGRTIVPYFLVSIPLVFSSYILGFTPAMIPYMCYLGGSIAMFAAVVSEKYGLFNSGVNKTSEQGKQLFTAVNKTRVNIQLICIGIAMLIVSLSYTFYSPEWYQEEVDITIIRQDIQKKMNDIMSGELLKDTFLNDLFGNKAKHANAGLSNGKLGRVDSLTYANETALKVTTQNTREGKPIYLKGYVGEVYEGRQWTALPQEEKGRLQEFENKYLEGESIETLPSILFKQLRYSPYNYYAYDVKTMKIENIAAEDSVNYVPYLLADALSMNNGKVHSDSTNMVYYSFGLTQYPEDGNALNRVYHHLKMNMILQMNVINNAILSNWYGAELVPDWYNTIEESKVKYLNYSINDMNSNELQVPREQVLREQNTNTPSTFQLVGLFYNYTVLMDLMDTVVQFNEYEARENWYFNYIQDAYTKLPEEGLEQVRELVRNHKVEVQITDTQNQPYTTIDEVDGTSAFLQFYEDMESGLLDSIGGNNQPGTIIYGTAKPELIQEKYYAAIEYVQQYLASNTSYTLKPGKTPSGQDFVEYFLFDNKKGYCMHYASAATVMLRAMGVPARYVEGYVVTAADFSQAPTTGYSEIKRYDMQQTGTYYQYDMVTMDIKDTNAHAWVEVYLPGLGWQPIEVTGPYSVGNTIEIPPMNENPEATLKPTPKPSVTPKPSPSTKPSTTPKVSPTVKPSTTPAAGNAGNQNQGIADDFLRGVMKWYSGRNPMVQRILNLLMFLLVFAILAVIIIWMRREIVIRIRYKKIRQSDANHKVLYEYHIMERIYRKRGIKYSSTTPHADFVLELVRAYPFITEEGAKMYMNLILKAKFHHQLVTMEELAYIDSFHAGFIHYLYQNASLLQKWYYKYILVL